MNSRFCLRRSSISSRGNPDVSEVTPREACIALSSDIAYPLFEGFAVPVSSLRLTTVVRRKIAVSPQAPRGTTCLTYLFASLQHCREVFLNDRYCYLRTIASERHRDTLPRSVNVRCVPEQPIARSSALIRRGLFVVGPDNDGP